ncbi:hypothetical protein ALC62_11718 [Cyphomyrmex costatus]|uniref:Uncharacterized protein n=1 Tax=Cyphomyrmex costatus TaxID=456900 RepID=A0A195CB48_9HYME|nr:hypothetical protein ALC62_11718 [Cyphomyrmex costatus]
MDMNSESEVTRTFGNHKSFEADPWMFLQVGGIRNDRVIGRLVICRDNDNGVLRPTSINVCDEGADKLES